MRLLTLLTILTVALACGRTPTGPKPLKDSCIIRVDTGPAITKYGQRVIITYWKEGCVP